MQSNINYIKKYKPSTPYFNLQLKEFYYSEEKNCLMDNNGSKKITINSNISIVEEIENKSKSQKYTELCILNSDFSIIDNFKLKTITKYYNVVGYGHIDLVSNIHCEYSKGYNKKRAIISEKKDSIKIICANLERLKSKLKGK